ncbi:DUF5683 domain-containing protein [Marinigracilibium pacificum]|uniref:DUF5683 domain-containing protein n=1 Tax=Marinigracilibium pacificum TaxID=2729599 RepID=A0A848IYH2_9BACT|nr:hypothetical protein [Marinigracilibium pacificum]NMM47294.1 hypothetical protein [Marinigracilibium pacificum]
MKLFAITALFTFFSLNITAQYNARPIHDFSVYKEIRKKHNPGLAGALSAVIPGGGQFYNKQPVKGIAILILESSAYYFMLRYSNREECISGNCKVNENKDLKTALLILIPVKTFIIFDAIHSAEKANQKLEIYFKGQQQIISAVNGPTVNFAPGMQLKYTF